jgi:hypothetical protein
MAYKEHPLFRLLRGDTQIWCYMDFTKFVSLLDTRALYFTNLEKMSEFDPFEGLYTRANLAYDDFLQHSSFHALPEELRKQFVDKAAFESYLKVLPQLRPFSKEQRRINYVNCWHESSYESAAMSESAGEKIPH